MFERYGADARQVLVFAHDEAKALEHGYVGTEHLLLGAIEQSAGIAQGFESLGVSLENLIAKIEDGTDPERRRAKGPRPYTPRAKRVLDLSNSVATRTGHDTVRPEHILLAVLDGEDVAVKLLSSLGADPATAQGILLELLKSDPIPARPAGEDEDEDEDYGEDEHRELEDEAEQQEAEQDEADEVAEPEDEGDVPGVGRQVFVRNKATKATARPREEVPVRSASRSGEADPACPRCDANLLETLRWQQHVAPGPDDDPLMVYMLYCSRCGRTLDVRSEE
jgi:ATP-dependent Clp protease ATP-binding subunit ClpA